MLLQRSCTLASELADVLVQIVAKEAPEPRPTALHYTDASVVANASLRKVADLLTVNAEQPLEVHHLACLLREQLTSEQLVQLRKSLAA